MSRKISKQQTFAEYYDKSQIEEDDENKGAIINEEE